MGLVLSGGGARGAFQVGVWEVLYERWLGAAPPVISGTSSGAINGALIAAGLRPRDMLAFWLDLADRPPIVANAVFFRELGRALRRLILSAPRRTLAGSRRSLQILAGLVSKHRSVWPSSLLAALFEYVFTARYDSWRELVDGFATAHLFSTEPLRERLVAAIGGRTIPHTGVRLAINAADVHSGQMVRFVNHRPLKRPDADASHYHYHPAITVDMVVASASIPLLFNTVPVDGMEMWDGGLLVNTPLAPAVALGAGRIVPLLVSHGGGVTTGTPTLGMALERLADTYLENAYSTDRKLLLERNRLAVRSPSRHLQVVELYEPIRPLASQLHSGGSYLVFDRNAVLEMSAAGRAAALQWLAAGPRLDTAQRERRVEVG